MKRGGFTIVELLAVIAIIAILATIITIASIGAIHNARAVRADSMAQALQQAITTYYAQEGKWPDIIETKIKSDDREVITFQATDNDDIIRQVVGKGFGKSGGRRSALIDASALLVADSGKLGTSGQKRVTALEFPKAANRNSKHHIPFSGMAFGYQDVDTGAFCRYWVTYDTKTDSVSVLLQEPNHDGI